MTDPGNGDSVVTAGTVLSGNVVTFTSRNLANSDSFTFSANDGFLESQESTISINIITDAPTAIPQEVSATEQIDKKISTEVVAPFTHTTDLVYVYTVGRQIDSSFFNYESHLCYGK